MLHIIFSCFHFIWTLAPFYRRQVHTIYFISRQPTGACALGFQPILKERESGNPKEDEDGRQPCADPKAVELSRCKERSWRGQTPSLSGQIARQGCWQGRKRTVKVLLQRSSSGSHTHQAARPVGGRGVSRRAEAQGWRSGQARSTGE